MERDASDEHFPGGGDRVRSPRWRQKRWAVPGVAFALLVAAGIALWFSRETIADDVIRQQLDSYGIPASYRIDRIGGRTQILSDVIFGDPQRPDFTAKRVMVRLRHRLGLPEIAAITLVEPRVFGTYRDGKLGFGSLDGLLFGPSDEAPSLPNIKLAVRDGRGLIETDFGPVGLKLEGAGLASHAWSGYLAVNAPALDLPGCEARGATAYGRLTTNSGAPRFVGPLRLGTLACGADGPNLKDYRIRLTAETDDSLGDPSLEARIDGGSTGISDYSAASVNGTVRAQLRSGVSTARYSLALRGIDTPQALAAVVTAEGQFRASDGFGRVQLESAVEGNGLRPGHQFIAAIESLSQAGAGTPLAPLTQRMAASLRSQARGSALEADLRLRLDPDGYSLLAPRAELRGGTGARIVSLSRVQFAARGERRAAPIGQYRDGRGGTAPDQRADGAHG